MRSYFGEMPMENYGQTLSQWITLFDSPEDDEYDCDFGEDDEEEPMINVFIRVEEAIIRTTARRERQIA